MTTHATSLAPAPTHAEAPEDRHAGLRDYLARAEALRTRQLDELPTVDRDPVMAAYRATVHQIRAEVRVARRRVDEGLYGVCCGCRAAIPSERLELRPWATTCSPCAARATP